ncbi:hypothetical protein SALBM311S_13017 [Streptomyces alboniger]
MSLCIKKAFGVTLLSVLFEPSRDFRRAGDRGRLCDRSRSVRSGHHAVGARQLGVGLILRTPLGSIPRNRSTVLYIEKRTQVKE